MADLDMAEMGGLKESVSVRKGRVLRADPYSRDMIEVDFSQAMANDALLAAVASYSLVGSDGSTPGVRDVMVPEPAEFPVTAYVLVITDPLDFGVDYTVSVDPSVRTATGKEMEPAHCSASFRARRTRIDAAIETRPRFLATRPRSLNRAMLITALRPVDIVGGSKNDRETVA